MKNKTSQPINTMDFSLFLYPVFFISNHLPPPHTVRKIHDAVSTLDKSGILKSELNALACSGLQKADPIILRNNPHFSIDSKQ